MYSYSIYVNFSLFRKGKLKGKLVVGLGGRNEETGSMNDEKVLVKISEFFKKYLM